MTQQDLFAGESLLPGLRAARRGALGMAAQHRAHAGAALFDHFQDPKGHRRV